MLRLCPAGFAILFLTAAVCANALGGETGTIEVEVVYKDTSEPVEGVYVMAEPEPRWGDGRPRLDAMTGPGGHVLFEEAAYGSYDVLTGCVGRPAALRKYGSTKFRFTLADCTTSITISPESPTVHIRFEVERGARLSGTVRRADGTPLAGASVSAVQHDGDYHDAAAMTDQDGRFSMYGLRPDAKATVWITHPAWLPTWPREPSRSIRAWNIAWRREVQLQGDSTVFHIEVHSASMELQLELIQPVWPFLTYRPCPGIWFDHDPEAEPRGPNIRIDTLWLTPAPDSTRSRTIYRVVLDDLSAGAQATTGLGAWYHVNRPTPRMLPSYTTYKTITLEEGPQKLRLVAKAPYARLSRVLLFGTVPAIVLAVCVTVLVRGARRHRAGERADQ